MRRLENVEKLSLAESENDLKKHSLHFRKISGDKQMNKEKSQLTLLDEEVQQCPYHTYTKLREESPVYLDPKTGFYVVTKFEDVKKVLKTPAVFGNIPPVDSAAFNAFSAKRAHANKIFAEKGWVPASALPFRGQPEHKQLRALYEKTFRASQIKKLEGFIAETTEQLFANFIETGSCDWVREFAIPLPLIVICHEMGAPKEDIWKIKEWTQAFFHRIGLMLNDKEQTAMVEKEIEAQHYFQPIFDSLRENPNGTTLSDLVNTEVEGWGRKLNDNELHAEMMASTFVGGSETTTNALASGVMLLAQQADVWKQLKSDPDKYLDTFVEEIVRLESPVQGNYRFVHEDTELGGVSLPKGATLSVRFGSANRDDDQFENASEIDLDRKRAAAHLGFGMGNHFCLGASLARLELRSAFKALLEKISSIELTDKNSAIEYHPHYSFRAPKRLNIDFKTK